MVLLDLQRISAGASAIECTNCRDSLRLYSPARFDRLPGLKFPALSWSFRPRTAGRMVVSSGASSVPGPRRGKPTNGV